MSDFETGHIEETGQAVQYAVRVFQGAIPVPTLDEPSATVPGSRKIELELKPIPGPLGSTHTLVLNDGRRLKFFVKSYDSVRVTGGFL